jgi:hypothetical protein
VQQVRVHPVRRMRLTRAGSRIDRLQAHRPEQSCDAVVSDRIALTPEPGGHAPHAIIWRLRILRIEEPHQTQILRALPMGVIIVCRPGQAQQVTLPGDADLRVARLDQAPFGVRGQGQLFFSPSPTPL